MTDTTLPALVARRAAKQPDQVILRRKARGIWQPITWAQLAEQVQRIAGALQALDLQPGDAVAILSETRPEAVYADLAAQAAGAASVVVHPATDTTGLAAALSTTRSRVAFVEGEEQLDKVLAIRGQCALLSRIVIFDMKGLRDFADSQCVSLSAFVTSARTALPAQPDRPAVILLRPAARVLTQREAMHMGRLARERLGLTSRDERLALLSMSEPVERIWGLYAALAAGCVSNYLESPDTAAEDLAELQPSVLGCDAATWAQLHARADRAARGATAPQRALYDWSIRSGNPLGRRLILGAVRRKLGLSRLRLAYTGGEPVSPATLGWARSLGIRIERIEDAEPADFVPDGRANPVMQNA